LAELEMCHRTNPGMHVRLLGYDNYSQSQGTAFVVYRAGAR
jgi:ribulose-bisphosphate carboxylase small chain